VAVLVETASSWGAGLVEGIAEYAQKRTNWSVFWEPRGRTSPPSLPLAWEAHGVIAEISHPQLADEICRAGTTAVDVARFRRWEGPIPHCTSDAASAAQLAAEYFIERGFRHFGYCGDPSLTVDVDPLGRCYASELQRRGRECKMFAPLQDHYLQLGWFAQQRVLANWLLTLPKPIGILAYDDALGRQLTEACKQAELQAPHQVAVLGGAHDQLSASLSHPPLSSLDLAPREVGEAAAALLDRLLRGEAPPSEPLFVPVSRIITRQSTDIVALEDDLLSKAVQFIRDHRRERIRVDDVVRAVGMSRRALEKGFRQTLGRSPAEEIRRARVDLAAEMLCATQWSMPQIAAECGFERPEMLTRAFRRELNITPARFRKKHQRPQADLSDELPR
jgi:LacI family transcriptional regulator